MTFRLGIRREDKNEWERRVPLVPEAVARLVSQGVPVTVEPSSNRVFPDEDFRRAGAVLSSDLSACTLVLGVKEIPEGHFRPGGGYCFFSHTIKAQAHNMGMLARLRSLGSTLLDYELIKDAQGRRLIFFGRHAGLAGALDTLWALGRRLAEKGIESPFLELGPAHSYADLSEARDALVEVGKRLAAGGIPEPLRPLVVGVTGCGNVSRGVLEILDRLPCVDVPPSRLSALGSYQEASADSIIRVVFNEPDLFAPLDVSHPFVLQDYYDRPERYRACFAPHLARLTVLINGIFWAPKYPRLATRQQFDRLAASGPAKLEVVGDISCDPDGSLACTVRETHPGDPVYVYEPTSGEARSGFAGPGIAVLAVGNLPCELPREASIDFSAALERLVPDLVAARWDGTLEESSLPAAWRGAVILWRGTLVPEHAWLEAWLP